MSDAAPPRPIPFEPALGKRVGKLIRDAGRLEKLIDEEGYSAYPSSRPAVASALAVQAAPWSRWSSSGLNIIRSVCGSAEHPLVKAWLYFVIERENVVDTVRRGRGILQAFLDDWRAGTLWAVGIIKEDEPITRESSK